MERGAAGVGVRDDFSGVDVYGPSGQRGNFRFAMKAHQNGAAGTVHFAKCIGQPCDAARVKSSGGLIEEQHGGPVNQSAGDGDALPHAARKGADQRVAALEEGDFAEQIFGACRGIVDILKFREQNQIFFGGELIVDHGGVTDITGPAVGSIGCARER
jgi:hypothetical protein